MANPNAPHGLQPVQTLTGSPWTGKANLYFIPSTDTNAYGIGDIVQLANNSDANGVPAIQQPSRGTVASGNFVGVVVGFQVAPLGVGSGAVQGANVNLNQQSLPATKSFAFYAWVADDPNLVFEIQADNAGTLGQTSTIGMNASYNSVAPTNTSTALSQTTLNTASLATTATLPLHVISLAYRVNQDFTANAALWVKINNHQYGNATAGV